MEAKRRKEEEERKKQDEIDRKNAVSESRSRRYKERVVEWVWVRWGAAARTTSSSAMAERPCDACSSTVTLKGWVTLRLNFRLNCYVSHQYLWTVRWGNGYTTTLLLVVFTQRNCVADFIRLKFNFIKKQKIAFAATLSGI